MNFVESVRIEGFWGDKTVFLKFDNDVNCLIGPNGSGKTTIINLIAAVLKGDYEVLNSIQFDSIELKLKTVGKTTKPVIRVTQASGGLYPEINFSVREKTSDKPKSYSNEDKVVRPRRIYRAEGRRVRVVPAWVDKNEDKNLNDVLGALVATTWLSVHRGVRVYEFDEDEDIGSAVDQKVRDISKSFANYFSLLGAKANTESRIFQEYIFLSLLHKRRQPNKIISPDIDVDAERSQLEQIFSELGMNRNRFESRVKSHFDAVEKAQRHLSDIRESEKEPLGVHEFSALMDSTRVHEVVDEWKTLQTKHLEIYSPKTKFEELLNNLFVRKKLKFNDRNEPEIITQSGKKFGPSVLSSGEKQLFILFGEALLQEQKPVVFIADEPELSLHVSWQSELLKNIISLNPNAQMIIATHSPDIVSSFTDCVIHVENHIK